MYCRPPHRESKFSDIFPLISEFYTVFFYGVNCHLFVFIQRTSFSTSSKAGLEVINYIFLNIFFFFLVYKSLYFLSFFLSPLFLKDSFTKYSITGNHFFSFSILNVFSHSLLAWAFLLKNPLIVLVGFPCS